MARSLPSPAVDNAARLAASNHAQGGYLLVGSPPLRKLYLLFPKKRDRWEGLSLYADHTKLSEFGSL